MTVLRKSILSIFGTGVVAVLNTGIGILLARLLLPAGLGRYSLVTSAATIAGVLGSLGIGKAAIYYMNRLDMDRVVATSAIAGCVASLSLTAFVGLYLLFGYEAYFSSLGTAGRLGGALYGAGHLAIAAAIPILVADMEIRRYVVAQVIPSFVLLAMLGLGAALGRLHVGSALVLAGVSQMAGPATLWWFLRDRIATRRLVPWDAIRSLVLYGFVLNLSYIVHLLIIEGGMFLVRALATGFDVVGYYKAAVRMASVILMAVTAVTPLLYSKYASSDEKNKQLHVERTSRVFWVLLLGLGTALWAAAHPLVRLLLGVEYLPAVPVLRILVVGVVARGLAAPMLNLFSSSGAALLEAGVLALGLVTMVGGMIWLIPLGGASGAAVAFLAGNVVVLLASYTASGLRFEIDLRRCFVPTARDIQFVSSNLGLTSKPDTP